MKRLLLAILLTIVFAAPAFSQMMDMPMRGGGDGREQMMDTDDTPMMGNMEETCLQMADDLGLSNDQIKKIMAIHRTMMREKARISADMKIARIDLMEIMETKDFDLNKAGAAVKKMADLRAALQIAMLKTKKDVRAILTEDQFMKMQKMMHMRMGAGRPMMKAPMKHQMMKRK